MKGLLAQYPWTDPDDAFTGRGICTNPHGECRIAPGAIRMQARHSRYSGRLNIDAGCNRTEEDGWHSECCW